MKQDHNLRIRPRDDAYLDRKRGIAGEIFFDKTSNSLRCYDGGTPGGFELARSDLENIPTEVFDEKLSSSNAVVTTGAYENPSWIVSIDASKIVGAGGGTVALGGAVLGDNPPEAPVQTGTLWLNTSTGKLYIYYNDGNSLQWIQPMTPSVGGGAGGGASSFSQLTGQITLEQIPNALITPAKLNLSESLLPTSNVTYDLGSATYRWRDLYLSGSSIKLGDATITATGTAVNLPAGSTINGTAIGSGNSGVTNILAGDNVTITNNSGTYTINAVVGGGGGGITLEQAQDGAATLFSNGSHTGITFTYIDGSNALNADVANIPNSSLTNSSITINGTSVSLGGTITVSSGVTSLDDLDDVEIISAASGQILIYNNNNFVNYSSRLFHQFAYPAITALDVTQNGLNTAYLFNNQYTGNNPTITAITGTTIAFNLNVTGHPFLIQTSGGSPYNTGLIHVAVDGTVSTGSNAQGKVTGTLYWQIPASVTGNYRYICSNHAGMVGVITVLGGGGLVIYEEDVPLSGTYTALNFEGASVTATQQTIGGTIARIKITPTFTELMTSQQSTEVYAAKTSATGTVVHDFSTGAIWSHASIAANFTANFTNVPTTVNRTIVLSLILLQGATPYIPNAVQIDGAVQTLNWQGGAAPTGGANKKEIVSFTLIRSEAGPAWTVLGSLTSYG